MKILKTQVLRGPNVWSNYRNRLIQVRLDLEDKEDSPTDTIDGFCTRLKTLLPGMITHECSEGRRGGFFERVERGTWLGHVMEHIALELQSMAGMEAGYGRTRSTSTKGVYNIVFTYEVEEAGLYAVEAAFRIVNALCDNQPYDLDADITELRLLKRRFGLGPSTLSIVQEAAARGIPWTRLGKNSKIRLGYGKNQKQFQATITCNTSNTAVNIAGDKDSTKKLLAQAMIPVAAGDVCQTEEGLKEITDRIGFPIVIKPLHGNHGKGATIGIDDLEAAKTAMAAAKVYGQYVIVERYITGTDFRLLVIDGKFVAAAKRIPAHIVGDGISDITSLIASVNSQPGRGEGHEAPLTRIKYDQDTALQLSKYGYTPDSIPLQGETVYLKSTANISTGGTAEDVTDRIHPENIFMAERIAKIIGLDICGIDIMATDLSVPMRKSGGVVLEVNAAPGFRMHLEPSAGKPRNVAKAVVDMLYPPGTPSTIPLFAVTGTNGKTTTTRLIAHMAKTTGYQPGYTTTDGIYIGDYRIKEGDTTGPDSGRVVLSDPTVDFAVLETARGGLLRGGLCFDQCDVGVITNIQEDHLGLNDIEDLQDLAQVKAVVARSVKENGWAVLNAEDLYCERIANRIDCNIAFFSMDETLPLIQRRIARGRPVAVLSGENIVIIKGTERIIIDSVFNMPLTENGSCRFMIANILAASLAAYCGGLPVAQIRQALRTFVPSYETTPGRMNLFDMGQYKVLVDYAHNPHGLLALKDYLSHFDAPRKVGIIAGIGDRRDEDTIAFAAIAAGMFDHIIVRQEHSLRGKTIDQINALVVQGIESSGRVIPYDLVPDESDAIAFALNMAADGDLIVALSDAHQKVVEIITETQKALSEIPAIQATAPVLT
ncbi:cyanophycin synthetase [Flavobacterium magnum]|uniref:Cyanophycin synthetase n=1 Tax=Flavobacterium magnum TaxID=2162713 RepID=A0A2S0REH3_9FLAO|nr:cyanophycin synthetase [Flavobacterium magnum]AWA30347.1 cyanophycin synthetase [Flavobacterium magnum]